MDIRLLCTFVLDIEYSLFASRRLYSLHVAGVWHRCDVYPPRVETHLQSLVSSLRPCQIFTRNLHCSPTCFTAEQLLFC